MPMSSNELSRRHCGGQALVETLLVAPVLLLLALGMTMIVRLVTIDLAAVGAVRVSAFGCALDPRACGDAPGDAALLSRFFDDGEDHVGSPHLWHDHRSRRLVQGASTIAHDRQDGVFDAPSGLLGARRLGATAADLVDRLAGPARFGLDTGRGLRVARLSVPVWSGRPADGDLLNGLRMQIDARLAVLGDAWNASGPTGPETSVSARVEPGSRPLLWPGHATQALNAPTHGFMRLMHALRLDADPDPLIGFELDVDLVPSDREAP